MPKILLPVLMLLSVLTLAVPAQVTAPPLRNLQLAEGEPGQVPTGWFGNMPGYTARLLAEGAAAGKRSVEIEFKEPNPQSNFGLLRQSFDATAYRGKRVRFRAAVRMEGETPQDRAQLWFRVDRVGGGIGFFDNMDARPIRSRDWQYFDITGDVSGDAQVLNIGMMLIQKGRAWISDMTLDVLGDTPKPVIEPARPLTSRGLRNEAVFAKLFGYVRYFHPSDEAFRADWDALALRGVRSVESAKDDAELAQALLTVFQPISPTLRVVGTGQQYARPAELNSPGANAKVTYWKHHGIGMGRPGAYHSDRVQETVAAATAARASMPDAPFRTDLGDGLLAWLPITLYVDGQGTLPHGPTSAAVAPALQPPASADDRGTRLADVILAWNVFEHFYPYFDVVKTDWTAELPKALQRAAVDPNETAFVETLQRMVAALHDGHGTVNTQLSVGGVLPLQWAWVENDLVITAVDPAAGLNVSVGDTVRTVNGRAARVALEAREELISGATPQWIRYRGLQDLLTGPPGQTASLEVESAREPGKSSAISVRYGPPRVPLAEKRPDKIAELESGIFYIDIGRVSEGDFNTALPQLLKARGIVFDFRGYPSGIGPTFLTRLYDKPLTSAQWHIPEVTVPDRQNLKFVREGEWNLQPTGPMLAAKKAFIVDGRAISYAESCLGIVENYKLGEIVGAPSAGTNGNVNPFALPGGYTISWTGMKVLKHDGSRHHGVGIQPTIPVSRTKAGIAAGRDEFLESAVAAVK